MDYEFAAVAALVLCLAYIAYDIRLRVMFNRKLRETKGEWVDAYAHTIVVGDKEPLRIEYATAARLDPGQFKFPESATQFIEFPPGVNGVSYSFQARHIISMELNRPARYWKA